MTKIFNSSKYGTLSVTMTTKNRDINFKVDKPITPEEACIIQSAMGYAPQGYGFYRFNGQTWHSATSCD